MLRIQTARCSRRSHIDDIIPGDRCTGLDLVGYEKEPRGIQVCVCRTRKGVCELSFVLLQENNSPVIPICCGFEFENPALTNIEQSLARASNESADESWLRDLNRSSGQQSPVEFAISVALVVDSAIDIVQGKPDFQKNRLDYLVLRFRIRHLNQTLEIPFDIKTFEVVSFT